MNQKSTQRGKGAKGQRLAGKKLQDAFDPLPLCVDFLPHTQLQLALKLAASPSDSAMSGFV
jgi:hypothetical protein